MTSGLDTDLRRKDRSFAFVSFVEELQLFHYFLFPSEMNLFPLLQEQQGTQSKKDKERKKQFELGVNHSFFRNYFLAGSEFLTCSMVDS